MLRESKGLVEDERAFMPALREAVRVRHAAQQAACWPNPEVHFFIKERIATVDKLRRRAEDQLFRGQVPKFSVGDQVVILEMIRQQYEAVQAKGDEVLEAIQVRDEAFASLPHLACTLLRFQAMDRKQFNFEQQARAGPKNGSQLFTLRDSWDEKWHLLVKAYRALGTLSQRMTLNRRSSWSSFESVPVQLLKENMADLKNWVGDQGTATSTAQNDGVIFRQITALLPSPHLTPRLRMALHLKGKAILDNDPSKAFDFEGSSAEATGTVTMRNELWNAFKKLPSPEPVLRARSRLTIHQQGKGNKIRDVKPAKQNLAGSDQALRKAEAELRAAALAYSVHAIDDPNSYDRVVTHRRGVHRHREHLWQSRRVLNDSWGDSKLVRSNKNWTPYFVRAANHYLNLAQIVDFDYGNSDLWVDLTNQIELQRSALSSIQSPRPEVLRVRASRNRSGEVFERHGVRLVCGQPKHLPDGDLTLSLWKSDMSELLRLHATTPPKEARFHALRLPIPETGQLRQHLLEVRKIGGDRFQTKLAFRGHHWEADASVIYPNDKFLELTHQVATPRPANITVEGAAAIKTMDVVFILDCSGSMLSGGRFAEAKEALRKLWDEMKRGQNRFRVGLFAFGHRSRYTASGSVDSLQEGVLPPDDTQWIYPANGRLSTKPSSDGDFQKLEAKLGKLAARGQTPLYLAISDVLKSLPTRNDKTEQRVIVISDGVNYQYPDSGAKNLVSFAKLKQLLEAKKESVKVDLLFLDTPADIGFWRQVYGVLQNAGLSEGNDAENEFSARRNNAEQIPLLTKGSYVRVDDLKKLADELNARFPREPQVAIYPASGSPRTRRELKHTWEFSPMDLGEKRVIVEYEKQTTPPLKLFLMGGERRTIHFLETTNQLLFPRFSHWSQCRQRQNGVPLTGGDMHSVGLFAAQGVPAGNKRAFQFIFENQVASKYSRRPPFLMAEIQQLLESNKPGRTFNIQDFQFLPDQSVPVARSADLPWFFSENSSQAEATAAKISLWIGDAKAIQAIWSKQQTLLVATGPTAISRRIGGAEFKISRNNVELLRVEVAVSERCEQWLLDCPEAESVTRQWNLNGKSAIHTFRILPKFWNEKAGVTLRLANVDAVKRHATPVNFKQLPTIRR